MMIFYFHHFLAPSIFQVWFQNRRSKERRMKQLSALGARRAAFFQRRLRGPFEGPGAPGGPHNPGDPFLPHGAIPFFAHQGTLTNFSVQLFKSHFQIFILFNFLARKLSNKKLNKLGMR